MEGGLLNNVVVFLKLIKDTDDYGHEKIRYVDAFQTRANVKWNGGDRVISNEEIVYDNTLTFLVRSYCPIKETQLIKYKNKKYRILTINKEDKLYDKIDIVAEEINE